MIKIENIEKVFIVVRKRAKYVRPAEIFNDDFTSLAVFKNRAQAKTFIAYWSDGNKTMEIHERKLT